VTQEKPEFRFRLNGRFMPEMRIERSPEGNLQIAVRDEDVEFIGWFVITNDFVMEFRDETAWALLPVELRRESTDKGWCKTTPREFIEILCAAGVIR
jgi:hypothetical protein